MDFTKLNRSTTVENDYLGTVGSQIRELGLDAAVILGGSYDYNHSETKSHDIDLLLVIDGREQFLDLVSEHQNDLDSIFKIVKPETHFSKDGLEPLFKGYADSLRYSGINNLGRKISVKILEYDYLSKIFHDTNPGRINVLSKKDRRFYPHKTIDGQELYFGVINQKTQVELTILGDPDLFTMENNFALGVIADILISGRVLFEGENVKVVDLKKSLVKKIADLSLKLFGSTPSDWSQILIRSDRFPENFKLELNQEIQIILGREFGDMPKETRKIHSSDEYNISLVSPVINKLYPQTSLPKKTDKKIVEYRYIKSSGPFSSNSNYGIAIFSDGKTSFFKEMLNELRFRSEIYGLLTVSTYFGHLQQPIYTDPEKNLIAYEWNPGDILARRRLVQTDEASFKMIMELELRRAEDHLNAYLLSATDLNKRKVGDDEIYGSRIHDLFYARLRGSRLREFYSNTVIQVGGRKVNFFGLLDLTPVINGFRYKPVSTMIENAVTQLNPERLRNKLMICGLGDAHCGNVMVSGNDLDDYLYIDFEFAGFHSPYLDMAKAIYNDCFFGVLYIDKLLSQKYSVDVYIDNGDLIINHDYKLDRLSQFLLKTKIEGVILPMRNYLSEKGVGVDDDWEKTLGCAMLCCGLFTRNLSEFDQKSFLINLANTIEATSFGSYYKKLTA